MNGNDGVRFKRGKVRVLGIQAVLIPVLQTADMRYWYRLYNVFWSILVSLQQLSRGLRCLRRMFGSSLFDGEHLRISFKWRFYRIMMGSIFFKKSWYKLKARQRHFTIYLAKVKFTRWRKLPFWKVFKQIAANIMKFRNRWVSKDFDDRIEGLEFFERFNRSIPVFDNSIFGGEPLTKRQMRRLAFRKYNVMYTML
jgi:hypothetical protein